MDSKKYEAFIKRFDDFVENGARPLTASAQQVKDSITKHTIARIGTDCKVQLIVDGELHGEQIPYSEFQFKKDDEISMALNDPSLCSGMVVRRSTAASLGTKYSSEFGTDRI